MTKRVESALLLFAGFVITACGAGIYFIADTVKADASSPRVRDLYRVLQVFGKMPTVVMICAIGLILVYMGLKKGLKK